MDMSPITLRLFACLLQERTGQALSPGRRWRIETALRPVMKAHDIPTLDALAAALGGRRTGPLVDEVVDALLNNETYFYRELSAFDQLSGAAFERLRQARAASRKLRIWCAGCSTGQEAYSIAMSIAEQPALWTGWTVELVGTDISRAAISQARAGLYTQFEIQRGLPIRKMMHWFEPAEGLWQAKPELRARVRFQTHNLLDPPPFPLRCDVILCRNVLLYFTSSVRQVAFDRLAQAIAPDGLLMLGAGETVMGQTVRFEANPTCRGFYRLAAPEAAGAGASRLHCHTA